VLFTGLGSTTGEQPPLPLPQRTTLSEYWQAICAAMGATECRVDDTRVEPAAPTATVATPAVPVDGITSVTGPDDRTTTVLSNDMLGFTGDSAALSPVAIDLLHQIAERINAKTAGHPDAVVTVNGYAADPPRSTDQGRRQLSQQRADATRQALTGDGVTARIEAHGLGTPPGSTAMVGGVFTEAVASGLRRVEITY
jgi:outer membrane protein OmpA-like peptidoglycan-associated protein